MIWIIVLCVFVFLLSLLGPILFDIMRGRKQEKLKEENIPIIYHFNREQISFWKTEGKWNIFKLYDESNSINSDLIASQFKLSISNKGNNTETTTYLFNYNKDIDAHVATYLSRNQNPKLNNLAIRVIRHIN